MPFRFRSVIVEYKWVRKWTRDKLWAELLNGYINQHLVIMLIKYSVFKLYMQILY